jgi:hypothetical protein
LENVERLIPDKLSSSVDEIMTLSVEKLKMLPKPEMPTKKWID